MGGQRISPAEVSKRIAAIDALRLTRPLTPEEKAEADNLAARQYQRVYRQTDVYALGESRRAARRRQQQMEARHA